MNNMCMSAFLVVASTVLFKINELMVTTYSCVKGLMCLHPIPFSNQFSSILNRSYTQKARETVHSKTG